MYTYIDLFSGPGGLCTGFKNAGFKPLIAVEMSDNTVQTYARNHDAEIYKIEDLINNRGNLEQVLNLQTTKTCLIHGDVRAVDNTIILEILEKKFNATTVDVVAGGPPCESFSNAGKRLIGDERDDLFENMLRIANCTDSKFIFFENVPGIFTKKNKDNEKVFEIILDEFEEAGYEVASKDRKVIQCLASEYGVPQNRERVFIIAINKKYGQNTYQYPEKTHGPGRKYEYLTTGEVLKYLPVLSSGEGQDIQNFTYNYEEDFKNNKISENLYNYMKFMSGEEGYFPEHLNYEETTKVITIHKAVNHRPKMVKRMECILQGEGMKKAAERLVLEGKESLVAEYFPNKLYAARNRRLKSNEPSFTVTSHCLDEMIHPISHRGLTPRETARLQSFPDWYFFEGEYVKFHGDPAQDKYEQCGDAIPVLLVKALADNLKIALDSIQLNSSN
ncbi:MAG: DNA cytosine methyltransferase [Clostridium chrysemydis]|uniref:DNA cytosine methyltransferase n=1 Tax=Clostridium chrysemydis TaxID=2665504 RepID=UPI003F39F43C